MLNLHDFPWSALPKVADLSKAIPKLQAVFSNMLTLHEGIILYERFWNFWVRAGVCADTRASLFFRDYEQTSPQISQLLSALGTNGTIPASEIELWDRTGKVWNWLGQHAQDNGSEYIKISSQPNTWPSLQDYAAYYAAHGHLVWAACFSKAHLFATLLGRTLHARWRLGIAQAHHTEGGAPPTASHVFVGIYLAQRWFYLDPTALPGQPFPIFQQRASLGVNSFSSVDYEHPYDFIPLPQSSFSAVPYLPA